MEFTPEKNPAKRRGTVDACVGQDAPLAGQADPKTLNILRKCCLNVKTASVPSAKNMLLGVYIW